MSHRDLYDLAKRLMKGESCQVHWVTCGLDDDSYSISPEVALLAPFLRNNGFELSVDFETKNVTAHQIGV